MKVRKFPVPMRLGDTPVPIPNTMVKTQTADGTILETVWESRWVPDLKKEKSSLGDVYIERTHFNGWRRKAKPVQSLKDKLRKSVLT